MSRHPRFAIFRNPRTLLLLAGLILNFLPITTFAQITPKPRVEDSKPPADRPSDTVDLLKASRSGDLEVVAQGQGDDRVRVTIRNRSSKRLHVVIPAGLIASAGAAQGGLQSMGLGSVTNRLGSFGEFQTSRASEDRPSQGGGLLSVPAHGEPPATAVTLPVGETQSLIIPAVCLNFGLDTPTPNDTFVLVDANEYTTDPLVRRALRSLATRGTSQGVAQAVMWRVCNDVSFQTMREQGVKKINEYEYALASRFLHSLGEASGEDSVSARSIEDRRVFLQVIGDAKTADAARRLQGQLKKTRILGLPVTMVETTKPPLTNGSAILIKVQLGDRHAGETRGRITVSYNPFGERWAPLGKAALQAGVSPEVIEADSFAAAVDRAVSSAFVSVKPVKKGQNSTSLRVENRLPFTIANFSLKAGTSAGAPVVPFEAIGVGPFRNSLISIQAPTGTVEQVELNGL